MVGVIKKEITKYVRANFTKVKAKKYVDDCLKKRKHGQKQLYELIQDH